MSNCRGGVAVRCEQLSGANTQREGVVRLQLLDYVYFRQRSNRGGLVAQSLFPRTYLGLDVSTEFAIEITLAQLQHLSQDVGRVRLVTIECEHAEDRVKPETVNDELANLRGLKICNSDVLRRTWSLKCCVEIRDLEPAPGCEAAHKQRVPVIPPTGPRAPLFVN